VSLQIEDDGIAFNPLEVPERVAPTSLEDAPIGGLGVALIRKTMERCEYARRGGRNVLRLSATLPR
jgi:serine/threonine-protein kinase RsbW